MKKVFSILLVLVLAFSLFGCGEGEVTPSEAPTAPTSESPTEAPTENPTAKPLTL